MGFCFHSSIYLYYLQYFEMEHSSTNPQFDSFIGGSQSVPEGVNLSDFIKHRMEEVIMLTDTIKESPFRGQTFQRLPKHMRRRQMSHHIRRLPRKLQRPYLLSLKEGLPTPTKCPSRKYRRRPSNLLAEYNRRQKDHVWLETHIWHAKRFHMMEKWGYKLPEKPTNKSFRASYRAISEHCLLNDISYYNCIELQGSQTTLLENLQKCVSSDCGLTFAAQTFLSGVREGYTTLFHPDCYPYKVLGNMSFMWKPVSDCNENWRCLWIWVHPAIHQETVECFKTLFNLKEVEIISEETQKIEIMQDTQTNENITNQTKDNKRKQKQSKKYKNKSEEQIKLEPKNVPHFKTPKYVNNEGSVKMILLKDTLNRFQLTGPLSQAIITQAFDTPSVYLKKETNSDIEVLEIPSKKRKLDVEIITEESQDIKTFGESSVDDTLEVIKKEETWWEKYYENKDYRNHWEDQKNFYKKISCCFPNNVPSGIILSLIIGDPRLTIPSKREKALPKQEEPWQLFCDSIEPSLCQSPIWCPELRDKVSMSKLSTQEINEARAKKIVPGFDVKTIIPDEKQSRIPILLVQRPGQGDNRVGKLGFGSGWDIIAPAGFGMPIWLSLILRGARAGGVRETELLQLESNNLNGYLQPDSNAGIIEAQKKYKELRTRHFKSPPNSRPNYVKLGISSPFYCPWKVLVNNWISKSETDITGLKDYFVLRNVRTLKDLSEIVRKFKKNNTDSSILKNIQINCLVPIVIECPGKGRPKDFAILCIPSDEDFKNMKSDKSEPTESSHLDENETQRKILKSEHTKLLKSLRRKRKKDRSKLKEEFASNLPSKLKWKDIIHSNSAPSDGYSEEYNNKMESLWVPEIETLENITDSCSRTVLGFIVKGDFSFSKSNGVGIGYITIPGLTELLSVCKKNESKVVVLVRNINHVQYRFANLNVIG